MAKFRSLSLVRGAAAVLAISLCLEAWSAESDSVAVAPTTTISASRGLVQTPSAESMGAGRLSFSLLGTWYKQAIAMPNVPEVNSGITTGIAAFSFGVNSCIDVFASVAGYGLLMTSNEFGLGSVMGGIQGSLPLPRVSPLYLGAQIGFIGGTSDNQINTNGADGYNYFETRTGYDFFGKTLETLVLGSERLGVKFLLDQGIVMSLQSSDSRLLILGGGIEGIVHPILVLGLEVNSRTSLSEIKTESDPLWLTPSVQIRTPYYFNVIIGSDISLSSDRSNSTATRAIEPYRVFGGFAFSLDLLAGKRAATKDKERSEAAEKADIERKAQGAQARADRLERKAQDDSIALATAHEAEQLRADSMARKAKEDSIALAETNLRLDEERSKRSDAEKQLLSTGLLLLDAVYFETGKSEISINSLPYLNIIGKMLTKYPKLQIEVSGHTDNIGRLPMNISLSQARADAVRAYLMQVAPELSERISARGYGPTQPKADNATASGRKINRRVELQVMNKDALKEYNR